MNWPLASRVHLNFSLPILRFSVSSALCSLPTAPGSKTSSLYIFPTPTHLVVTFPSGIPFTQFLRLFRRLLFTLRHRHILFWNPLTYPARQKSKCNTNQLRASKYSYLLSLTQGLNIGHSARLELTNIGPLMIPWLSIIWKSDLTDKMKRSFFQAAVVSILLYGCTTWMLTKRLEKKQDGNYTRMLRVILNKSWRQH